MKGPLTDGCRMLTLAAGYLAAAGFARAVLGIERRTGVSEAWQLPYGRAESLAMALLDKY